MDDSVHFLSKYLRAKRELGLNPIEASRYAYSTVGSALVITSAILVGGFMVLSQSTFALNASTGSFVSITYTRRGACRRSGIFAAIVDGARSQGELI